MKNFCVYLVVLFFVSSMAQRTKRQTNESVHLPTELDIGMRMILLTRSQQSAGELRDVRRIGVVMSLQTEGVVLQTSIRTNNSYRGPRRKLIDPVAGVELNTRISGMDLQSTTRNRLHSPTDVITEEYKCTWRKGRSRSRAPC